MRGERGEYHLFEARKVGQPAVSQSTRAALTRPATTGNTIFPHPRLLSQEVHTDPKLRLEEIIWSKARPKV